MKNKYHEEQPIYESRSRRKRKKKSNWLPYTLLFLAFIIAAVAGALFASSSLFDKNTTENKDNLMVAKDKVMVMIMGVDEREGDVGRSDTLLIATLDPKKGKAALLSIPRDTRVKIKGHGFDKINAAYAYGGHQLTENTIENLMGVDVEHYVIINIKAFHKIIDAIGGVDINVEKRMYYEDPWDDNGGLVIDLHPGMQHMDGKTAITYVRYRDEEGDIGRIARQQRFMQAVMDKVTSPAIIPRIPAIISEVIGSIKTDLSVKQIIEFVTALKSAQKNGLQTEMLPGKPVYIDGVSYWIPDLAKLRATIANTLDLKMSSSARYAMERDSQEYQESLPENTKDIPVNEEMRKKYHLDEVDEGLKNTGKGRNSYGTGRDNNARESSEERRVPADSGAADNTQAVPARSNTSERYAPSPSMPSAGKTAN